MLRISTTLSHSAVLVTTAIACLTYDQSPVFERPTQSSIVVLAVSGFAILSSLAVLPNVFPSAATSSKASALPLQKELPSSRGVALRSKIVSPWHAVRSLPPPVRRDLVVVAVGLCAFIELFHFTTKTSQCIPPGFLGYTPAFMAFLTFRHGWNESSKHQGNKNGQSTKMWSSSSSSVAYLCAITCLAAANALTLAVMDHPSSTFICSASPSLFRSALQALRLILSFSVSQTLANIIEKPPTTRADSKATPEALGYIFIMASTILFLGGLVGFLTHPMHWQWVFNFGPSYVLSLSWYTLLLTVFSLAALQIIVEYGILHLVICATFVAIYNSGISHAKSDRSLLSSSGAIYRNIFVILLSLSLVLYLYIGGAGPWERQQRPGFKTPRFAYAVILVAMVFLRWSIRDVSQELGSHPIASLMTDAAKQSIDWTQQASHSQTLEDAASEYRRRYGRHPPPGFDAWYRYATERSTLVIDDYDSIEEDLRPFWGISPAEVRLRTQEVISDTWNDVAEIRIRNGRADLGVNFKPTHRWMLDGILSMISDFSIFIPDMDLAFNLNDEPRVAVPFAMMQRLEKAGNAQMMKATVRHRWSPDRAKTWPGPEEVSPSRPFGNYPRINSFSAATVACPPTSPARTSHIWDPHPLYISSSAPHSSGPFLSNWTHAASPCHQPDLRNLHGFYLSPAAFKTSHSLLPIFSQSKVVGFADILYPSPWNYIDKVVYSPSNNTHSDPPFAEKDNSLFWRGGTSEGVSRFGTWKGMARQRFVNLITNRSSPTLPFVVPHPSRPGKYTYTSNPKNVSFTVNVGFVGEFARAWDNDDKAQAAQFTLVEGVDFQDHWKYRYLFDTDGAGFSGRLIPFLQSRSLPFRAGIFRTWYDARLTAWRHFVPVDIRLHGLDATLAYFAGMTGSYVTADGRMEGKEANVEAGREIAEAGREWAGKVLRKEDMRVFMFRLLLEWGRVTDDRRDEIGLGGET